MTNTNTAAQAFADMTGEWQKMMMDSWSHWAKTTLQSDAFTTGSAAMMEWNVATQNQMRQLTGQYLEALDLPRRSDLARLSQQVLAVEQRLADGEDQNDDVQEQMERIESKLDALTAAIEKLAVGPAPTAEAKTEKKAVAATKPSKKTTTKKTPAKKASKKK